jgi:hypothetical protein
MGKIITAEMNTLRANDGENSITIIFLQLQIQMKRLSFSRIKSANINRVFIPTLHCSVVFLIAVPCPKVA